LTLTRDWYRLDRWASHRHEEVQGGCGNRQCCPAFPRTDCLTEMAAFGYDTVRVGRMVEALQGDAGPLEPLTARLMYTRVFRCPVSRIPHIDCGTRVAVESPSLSRPSSEATVHLDDIKHPGLQPRSRSESHGQVRLLRSSGIEAIAACAGWFSYRHASRQ